MSETSLQSHKKCNYVTNEVKWQFPSNKSKSSDFWRCDCIACHDTPDHVWTASTRAVPDENLKMFRPHSEKKVLFYSIKYTWITFELYTDVEHRMPSDSNKYVIIYTLLFFTKVLQLLLIKQLNTVFSTTKLLLEQ